MDTDHDKIIRTEEKVDALGDIVSEIKNNHLVHISDDIKDIQSSIGNINVKLAGWSGGIVVVIWLMEKFFK